MSYSFDFMEVFVRILKYLMEGLVVATAAFMFPNKKLTMDDVVLIGFVAAATFSLLDLYSPSLGVSARSGAGLGIGANLVGFPTMNNMPNISHTMKGP
jgi:4-amino-4-deoxy-L-arabinose transferase-like glycosyltransferase